MNATATPLPSVAPTGDPHEKTIDLRCARLTSLTERATTLYERGAHATDEHILRTLVDLIENKTLVSAHAQTALERIVQHGTPRAQDALILSQVRPHTTAVDHANVAIARLRALLADRPSTGTTAHG